MRFLGIAALGLVCAFASYATPVSGIVFATGTHHGFDAFFGDYRIIVTARDWNPRSLFCAFDTPCEFGGAIELTSEDPFHSLFSGSVSRNDEVEAASPFLLADIKWKPDGEYVFPRPTIPDDVQIRLLFRAPMSITGTFRYLDENRTPTGEGWNLAARGYLDFDGVSGAPVSHPDTGLHFDYNGAFTGEIEPIPEPETWVFLALGLGLIGLRRVSGSRARH